MTPDLMIGLWASSMVLAGSIIVPPTLCWMLSK